MIYPLEGLHPHICSRPRMVNQSTAIGVYKICTILFCHCKSNSVCYPLTEWTGCNLNTLSLPILWRCPAVLEPSCLNFFKSSMEILYPQRCNIEYIRDDACPPENINLSLFNHFGFFGLCFRCSLRTTIISARPIGAPGWSRVCLLNHISEAKN